MAIIFECVTPIRKCKTRDLLSFVHIEEVRKELQSRLDHYGFIKIMNTKTRRLKEDIESALSPYNS